MANNKAFKVKNGLELEAYSKAISDTAVDVFVYDTSKDSDGGAWRKRTQGTSWYNETLNTATRGSRKEFPAVAVIVAESSQVTIYDGDDPDLPMWMVFNSGTYTYIRNTQINSVAIKNGIMSVGGSEATYGLSLTDFIGDKNIGSIINTGTGYYVTLPISGRNNTVSSYRVSDIPAGYRLVNDVVNDVAMTVLPNASIDAAMGLPVPTIAVATDGGVSVIKDDGTVVDTTSTDVFEGVSFVKSEYGSDLYAVNTTFADDPQWYPNVGGLSDGFTFTKNFYANTPSYEKLSSDVLSQQSGNVFTPIAEHTFAVGMGTSTGIGLDYALNLVQHSTALDDSGLVAFINDDHNTGWQNGAIKLAALSDTDDTDVTGSELVTNGTFDSDLSGWTDYTSNYMTLSHNSGAARVTYASNFSGWYGIGQDITTVVGKTYVASYSVSESDSAMEGSYFYLGDSTILYGTSGAYEKSGTITGTFVATSTTTNIRTGHGGVGVGSGDYYTIDNFSVRLAEEDRSVNGNGLQVFGTVTKNPVATGADLVAYSGFSGSNYLEQPYNSGLDFGTGDFCYMGWAKYDGGDAAVLFHRGAGPVNGDETVAYLNSGGEAVFRIASSNNGLSTASNTVPANVWNSFCFIRRSGVIYIYINGKQSASRANTENADKVGHPTTFGVWPTNNAYFKSNLALWRISATVPSPEQIAKIYEDEKFLFQENAQATLYGSSDAVTALAYDDSTELLHVGTSAGRSVFQGLRRVDNTTTAVSAAISASNNLVGEQ